MATIDMLAVGDRGVDRRERRDQIKVWLIDHIGSIVSSEEARNGEGVGMKGHSVHYHGAGWQYIIGWNYNTEHGLPAIFSEQEDVIIDNDALAVQFKLTFL